MPDGMGTEDLVDAAGRLYESFEVGIVPHVREPVRVLSLSPVDPEAIRIRWDPWELGDEEAFVREGLRRNRIGILEEHLYRDGPGCPHSDLTTARARRLVHAKHVEGSPVASGGQGAHPFGFRTGQRPGRVEDNLGSLVDWRDERQRSASLASGPRGSPGSNRDPYRDASDQHYL
jgi:hypothetical protein